MDEFNTGDSISLAPRGGPQGIAAKLRTNEFFKYCWGRYLILLKRRAGRPKPWTADPILQEWRFTNVFRNDDTTTIQLRQIYDQHRPAPPEQHLLNCALYRWFGSGEFARALGWQTHFNAEHIRQTVENRQLLDLPVYTSAYVVSALHDPRPKHLSAIETMGRLWQERSNLIAATESGRWEPFIRELEKIKGLAGSGFMAKEVALDTLLTPIWPAAPLDLNTFVPVGKGARRGCARILGRDDVTDVPTLDVCLDVCRQLYAQRAEFWPKKWPDLTLPDIQWNLCEFDKYERVRLGGRAKQRYAGRAAGFGLLTRHTASVQTPATPVRCNCTRA